MVDLSVLGFFSQLNYLKRSEFVGSQDLTLGGAFAVTTKTVNHALGYVPFFQVGGIMHTDGILWSNDVVNRYTETSLSGTQQDVPSLRYWCDEQNLTITVTNDGSPTASGTRKVYWAIYVDYST